MKPLSFLSLLLAALVGGLLAKAPLTTASHATETALARVLRTQTLRCGYVLSEPYLLRDPNTGRFSGIAFDTMTALTKELGLKLDWAEETGWGSFQEGLNAGKFDAMCVPVYQSGARAKIALLTTPLFYDTLFMTKREGDPRFDSRESINQPSVRIKTIDNVTMSVKDDLFPQAQEDFAVQAVDETQLYLDVAARKADVGFGNQGGLRRFNASSPTKLAFALGGQPVRLFATSLAVKLGETDLKNALDTSIAALTTAGVTQKIVAPYAPQFQLSAP